MHVMLVGEHDLATAPYLADRFRDIWGASNHRTRTNPRDGGYGGLLLHRVAAGGTAGHTHDPQSSIVDIPWKVGKSPMTHDGGASLGRPLKFDYVSDHHEKRRSQDNHRWHPSHIVKVPSDRSVYAPHFHRARSGLSGLFEAHGTGAGPSSRSRTSANRDAQAGRLILPPDIGVRIAGIKAAAARILIVLAEFDSWRTFLMTAKRIEDHFLSDDLRSMGSEIFAEAIEAAETHEEVVKLWAVALALLEQAGANDL